MSVNQDKMLKEGNEVIHSRANKALALYVVRENEEIDRLTEELNQKSRDLVSICNDFSNHNYEQIETVVLPTHPGDLTNSKHKDTELPYTFISRYVDNDGVFKRNM